MERNKKLTWFSTVIVVSFRGLGACGFAIYRYKTTLGGDILPSACGSMRNLKHLTKKAEIAPRLSPEMIIIGVLTHLAIFRQKLAIEHVRQPTSR